MPTPTPSRPSLPALATLVALVAAPALVTAQESRGVNPADIDSRFDVIVKRVNLEPSGTTDILTLKYDYKLTNRVGLNFELPAYNRLSAPGVSVSGNGDLFARARYIVPAGGRWTVGGSLETVLPIASNDALGTGRYQLNVAGLAVLAVSPSFLTAIAVKQTTSVGGDGNRPDFSNTDVRLVPVFILPQGWAITGELRQTWEHKTDLTWQRVEVTLNKQLTAQWGASLSYGQDSGDRKDRGSVSAAVKYFF